MKYLMYMMTIGFAGMIFSFLPVFMGLQLFSGGIEIADAPIELSIKSEKSIFSIILGMGITIPFFLEFIVEILALYLKGRTRSFSDIILRW